MRETTAELPDGRIVPVIDDGMFLRPIKAMSVSKHVTSIEDLRNQVSGFDELVYKRLDDMIKKLRLELNNTPVRWNWSMKQDALKLAYLIKIAIKLVRAKEWMLAAPYLLEIGERHRQLEIENAYRHQFMAKRRADEGARKERGISNPHMCRLLTLRPNDWWKLKFGDAYKELAKGASPDERLRLANAKDAIRKAFARAKDSRGKSDARP